jgi:hypothetical protein
MQKEGEFVRGSLTHILLLPRLHAATYSRHGAPGPWPWPWGVSWWWWCRCRPSRRRADTATCNGRHELDRKNGAPDTHVRRKGRANSRALTHTHLAKVGTVLCACHEQLTAAQFCRVHASSKVALGADKHLEALHVCTLCQRRRNINVHRHTTTHRPANAHISAQPLRNTLKRRRVRGVKNEGCRLGKHACTRALGFSPARMSHASAPAYVHAAQESIAPQRHRLEAVVESRSIPRLEFRGTVAAIHR